MATSYKKKGAKTNKRTKSKAPVRDQDPPIIIKPGGGEKADSWTGLFVEVRNTNSGTIRTNRTLGDPVPRPTPAGVPVIYTHNHQEYSLRGLFLVTPLGDEVPVGPTNPTDWAGYQIKLVYH